MPGAETSDPGRSGGRLGGARSEALGRPVVAAALAGAALAPLAGPAAVRYGGTAPCRAEFQPDTLTIRDRPARVLAELPRDLGTPEGVDVPLRSGLQVRDTQADPDGRSWVLGIYLGGATAGAWTLELQGTDGRCRGVLTTRMPGHRPPSEPGEPGRAVTARPATGMEG